MHFNDAVLYVNPYFVVTPKGYTKHYYNGSQRIAALGEFVREGYIGGVLRIEVDEEPLLVAALYNQNDSYMKTSLFADSGSLQHDIALAKRRSTTLRLKK